MYIIVDFNNKGRTNSYYKSSPHLQRLKILLVFKYNYKMGGVDQ